MMSNEVMKPDVQNPGERPLSSLLFDFGGTLDAEGVPWKERFFRFYQEEGFDFPAEEFDRAFYRADDALEGAIPATLSLGDTVGRLARGVTAALGLEDAALAERVARRFLDEALRQLSCNAALLRRLSGRYRLGVISNFHGNLETICREAGLTPSLSVVIDSSRVGYRKPDPRIFSLALEELGLGPAQAVFVGDSLKRDMGGAHAAGLAHIWLKSEKSRSEGPCCPDAKVIHTLGALQEMFL